MAAINGDDQKLGFGEFVGWTYMEILKYKPKYIEFTLGDIDDVEIPETKRFAGRIQYNNVAIVVREKTGSSE